MAAALGTTAQTDIDPGLLGRVRQHVATSVAELANYTCQETMERSVYAPTRKIEFFERLRLELLYTAGGELFAWPGSAEFATEPLESWIGMGAIGTGNFAVELHNLFVASAAIVRYGGLEARGEEALYRFDFDVPVLSSRYILSVNGKSAVTAYSGSFWVRKESLDPVRLEIRAQQIPPDLDCREAHESVTYRRFRLGADEPLLPSAATLVLVQSDGHESRNSAVFSRCHRYAAQTALSFDTTSERAMTKRERAAETTLPPGVTLILRLEQPISGSESAAGDELVARLDKAVTVGSVSLPKGTLVLGRIRRLEQHFTTPASNLVGLEFFAAQPPDSYVAFSARLTGPRSRTLSRFWATG